MTTLLPVEFAALEPFAQTWCLATETERYHRRVASSMEEMQAFHDAFFPRLEEAIEYCDTFPLDELPDDVVHLVQLIHSLIMVAMSVEVFKQPNAINAADAVLRRVTEPFP